MSSKRILGLLSVVFGSLVATFGVWALFAALRFTILQPIVIVGGGGLVLIGVLALKSAPATRQPVHDASVAQSGASASSAPCPSNSHSNSDRPFKESSMKKCPFCAEEIQSAAILCKHCKKGVTGQQPPVAVGAATPVQKTSVGVKILAGVFALGFMGWCSSLMNPPASTSTRTAASEAQKAAQPTSNSPQDPAPKVFGGRGRLVRDEAPDAPLALLSMTDEISGGGGYHEVKGEVKNVTNQSLRNVMAVVTFYDAEGGFITSDDAMIDYNPILPGQRSPYKVMTRRNPAMAKYSISFKTLFGGTLDSRDDRKK